MFECLLRSPRPLRFHHGRRLCINLGKAAGFVQIFCGSQDFGCTWFGQTYPKVILSNSFLVSESKSTNKHSRRANRTSAGGRTDRLHSFLRPWLCILSDVMHKSHLADNVALTYVTKMI